MSFYSEMQGVASEVLAEFKQGTVVLRRTVPGASDPSTPWIPGDPVVTDYTLDAVVSGVAQEYENGTTIVGTDLQVTCAVPAVMPDMTTDTLLVDGVAVVVIKNMPIPEAGTPVAYRFIVKG